MHFFITLESVVLMYVGLSEGQLFIMTTQWYL